MFEHGSGFSFVAMKKRPAASLPNSPRRRGDASAIRRKPAAPVDFEIAKEKAIASGVQYPFAKQDVLSKVLLAVPVTPSDIPANMLYNTYIKSRLNYDRSLSEHLSLEEWRVSSVFRSFIISFGYRFPTSSCLASFSKEQWQDAVQGLQRSFGWVRFDQAKHGHGSMHLCPGEVNVKFESFSPTEALENAARVDDVADNLVYGPSPVTEHTDKCNEQLKLMQTPENAQRLREVKSALSLAGEPAAFLKIESRIEASRPIERLSSSSLQALAKSLRVAHVTMPGQVVSVSVQGRFSCKRGKNSRYGCFICDTGPMAYESWYEHVFAAGHRQQVRHKGSQEVGMKGSSPDAEMVVSTEAEGNASHPHASAHEDDPVILKTERAKPCSR